MKNFDEVAAQTFLTAIRGGSDLETALEFAGLSNGVLEGWLDASLEETDRLERGDAPRPAYAPLMAFYRDFKKARVEPIVRNVARVQQAAQDGSWQAAAWWLERAVPDKYGKPNGKEKNFAPFDRPDISPSMD